MGLIKVLDEGKVLYGYRCPTCGRKVLHDTPIESSEDIYCTNCGDRMESTNIPKKKNREPEDSPDGGGSSEETKERPDA